MSFFLGSWDMNRSAEQTNRTRTASRFTRFVCSALRFISHEPRKKDTHSLITRPALQYTQPARQKKRLHVHVPDITDHSKTQNKCQFDIGHIIETRI